MGRGHDVGQKKGLKKVKKVGRKERREIGRQYLCRKVLLPLLPLPTYEQAPLLDENATQQLQFGEHGLIHDFRVKYGATDRLFKRNEQFINVLVLK
jgi:hypothetical protein